jgi:hypothetical protein
MEQDLSKVVFHQEISQHGASEGFTLLWFWRELQQRKFHATKMAYKHRVLAACTMMSDGPTEHQILQIIGWDQIIFLVADFSQT